MHFLIIRSSKQTRMHGVLFLQAGHICHCGTQSVVNLGSGSVEADPLARERLVAVDVGVESKELFLGHAGALRHGEAGLVRLLLVHLVARQRRHVLRRRMHGDPRVREGSRRYEERRDQEESSGSVVGHCKRCRGEAKNTEAD